MKLAPKIIAEGWIDLHTSKLSPTDRAIGEWVNEAIDLAIFNDADYAFEIIEAIHDLDSDQACLDVFAAGPIELTLTHQGVILIDRFERKARSDSKFATVLGGVWQHGMMDDTWKRIKACRKE